MFHLYSSLFRNNVSVVINVPCCSVLHISTWLLHNRNLPFSASPRGLTTALHKHFKPLSNQFLKRIIITNHFMFWFTAKCVIKRARAWRLDVTSSKVLPCWWSAARNLHLLYSESSGQDVIVLWVTAHVQQELWQRWFIILKYCREGFVMMDDARSEISQFWRHESRSSIQHRNRNQTHIIRTEEKLKGKKERK